MRPEESDKPRPYADAFPPDRYPHVEPDLCRVCGLYGMCPMRLVGYVCERCLWVAERRAGVAGEWDAWCRERRAKERGPSSLLADTPHLEP